jgi:hypothetical protein
VHGEAAADPAHIGGVGKRCAGGDHVGFYGRAVDVAWRQRKARASAKFNETDVELVQRKLLRVVGDDRGFEGRAGLALEIVDVIDADGTEPVPVRLGDKIGI